MINVLEFLLKARTKKNSDRELLCELGLDPRRAVPEFIRNSKGNLRKLLSIPETTIKFIDNNIIIKILDNDYLPTTQEEVYILKEIFIEGIYNFELNEPCIVIDIGMNVGFSSLFFASKSNVKKVLGYEPFKPTYERALENFKLNPMLLEKLEPNNVGVGIRNETRSIAYCEEWKGSASITDDLHFRPVDGAKLTQEEFSIVSAEELFSNIYQEYPEIKKICKIDCEGSEYDIFRALVDFQGEHLPAVFMIEWHYRGSREIVDFLTKRGYLTFSFPQTSQGIGMIYATKL